METLFGTPILCRVLIGRGAELTALRLLVDRARSGTGQIVLLSGEAGIGNRAWWPRRRPTRLLKASFFCRASVSQRTVPVPTLLCLICCGHTWPPLPENRWTQKWGPWPLRCLPCFLICSLCRLISPRCPHLILSTRNVVFSPPWLISSCVRQPNNRRC